METLAKIPALEPGLGECNSFKRGRDSDPQVKSVAIVPIRIMQVEDGSVVIAHACNRGEFCHETVCRYAKRKRGLD